MSQHLRDDGGLGQHIAHSIIEQTTGISLSPRAGEQDTVEPETPLPNIVPTIASMDNCPICETGSPDFDFIQNKVVGLVGVMVRCENDCFGHRLGSAPTAPQGQPTALTPYQLATLIEALVRWWGDMCAALRVDATAVQRVRGMLQEQQAPPQVGPAGEQ